MVLKYNTRLETVPTNIIGNMFHFQKKDYLDIPDDGAESKPVEVKF